MDHNGPPGRDSAADDATMVARPVAQAARVPASGRGDIDAFLREANPVEAIVLWLGDTPLAGGAGRDSLVRRLSHDVSVIDALLSEQVSEILRHPAFQKLEAVWRGLAYLTDDADLA